MSAERAYLSGDRRARRLPPAFAALSALGAAAIIFATLCPIGLRPHLAGANSERMGAYFVLGFLLALTFRRRWLQVTLAVVLLALALEAAQLLVPGRDARLADATIKALGGLMGSGAGFAVFPIKRGLTRLMGLAQGGMLVPRLDRADAADSLGS